MAATGRGRLRGCLINAGLMVGSLLLAVLLAEGWVRVDEQDHRMLESISCLLRDDVYKYRRSDDVQLLYEPRAGIEHDRKRGRRGEPGWPIEEDRISISTDGFGARGGRYTEAKPDGVFRVLLHGPSTVWGAHLDDDETLGAALERTLERAGGGRVEVWTFAASGHVLAQSARYARRTLARFDPDLVVVLVTNTGGRCEFEREPWPLVDRLQEDPWAAVEYLPPPRSFGPPPDDLGTVDPDRLPDTLPWTHRAWFAATRLSGLGRLAAATHERRARQDITYAQSAPYRDVVNLLHARALVQDGDAAGVPVAFVDGPGEGAHPLAASLGDVRRGRLSITAGDPTYWDLHPAPWVMEWQAERLAFELSRLGLVPVSVDRPGPPDVPEGVNPVTGSPPSW